METGRENRDQSERTGQRGRMESVERARNMMRKNEEIKVRDVDNGRNNGSLYRGVGNLLLWSIPCALATSDITDITYIYKIIALVSLLYCAGCLRGERFSGAIYGAGIIPLSILFIRRLQLHGDQLSPWLAKDDFLGIIFTLALLNACKLTSESWQSEIELSRLYSVLLLFSSWIYVIVAAIRLEDGVIYGVCVVMTSLGTRYIQRNLCLPPFEVALFSSIFFCALHIDLSFEQTSIVHELSKFPNSDISVIIVSTTLCTSFFLCCSWLFGLLELMKYNPSTIVSCGRKVFGQVSILVTATASFISASTESYDKLSERHFVCTVACLISMTGIFQLMILNGRDTVSSALVYSFLSVIFVYVRAAEKLQIDPILWLMSMVIFNDNYVIICSWLLFLLINIPMVPVIVKYLSLRTNTSRKLFHLIATMIFSPSIIYRHSILYISMAAATCIFVIVEIMKLLNVPGTMHIKEYFSVYLDKRDDGKPVVLSHLYLLLGCAFPTWIGHAIRCADSSNRIHNEWYSLVAPLGIITVGIGDAAAAVIGKNVGVLRWVDSSKTFMGSIAGFLFMIGGFILFRLIFGYLSDEGRYEIYDHSGIIFMIILLVCLLEGVTKDADNLLLPFYSLLLIFPLYQYCDFYN